MQQVRAFFVLVLALTLGWTVSSYPEGPIPHVSVRRDVYTNATVSRGRLRQIFNDVGFSEIDLFHFDDGKPPTPPYLRNRRFPRSELRKILQCAPTEPDLNEHSGSVSMIRLAPPSRRMAEFMAAMREAAWEYADGACAANIQKCGPKVEKSKRGQYTKKVEVRGGFAGWGMFRVMNNTLYHDWPWGRERHPEWKDVNDTSKPVPYGWSTFSLGNRLIYAILRLVSDMPDSLFLLGSERPFLFWRTPFPAFSMAARIEMGDMPWPWDEEYMSAAEMVARAAAAAAEQGGSRATRSSKNMSIDEAVDVLLVRSQKPWHERVPKAAFFAGYHLLRHMVYDQAVKRPDLIVAPLLMRNNTDRMKPWHPLSQETIFVKTDAAAAAAANPEMDHPGYLQYIQNLTSDSVGWSGGHFKYIVVIGYELSTTGRLAHALVTSGAVILLATTPFRYRFSSRLLPWVHYVPLSYGSADLIEKLEWLMKNDDQAQQIARNAAAFGKSYLRLEDELCYAMTALETVAEAEKDSDILLPFDNIINTTAAA